MLGVEVGALAGQGAIEVVAAVKLQPRGVRGQVHSTAAQGRVYARRQLGPTRRNTRVRRVDSGLLGARQHTPNTSAVGLLVCRMCGALNALSAEMLKQKTRQHQSKIQASPRALMSLCSRSWILKLILQKVREGGSLFGDNAVERLRGGVGAQAKQGPVVVVASVWWRERHLQTCHPHVSRGCMQMFDRGQPTQAEISPCKILENCGKVIFGKCMCFRVS